MQASYDSDELEAHLVRAKKHGRAESLAGLPLRGVVYRMLQSGQSRHIGRLRPGEKRLIGVIVAPDLEGKSTQ